MFRRAADAAPARTGDGTERNNAVLGSLLSWSRK